MYSVDEKFKKKLEEVNGILKDRFNDFNKDLNLLEFIKSDIGELIEIEPMGEDKLKTLKNKGGIVGVDGSVNRKGSAAPHYIDIFKVLAKSTSKNEEVTLIETFSPLLEDNITNILEDEQLEFIDKRNQILATLEIQVAKESIKKLKPRIILMDGSLVRYSIENLEEWNKLKEECIKEDVILAGVIEDIKTDIIASHLYELGEKDYIINDRELLFGKLEYGQLIRIKDNVNIKYKTASISSGFLSSALSPYVIAIDMIDEQRKYIEEIASLILSLTNKNSRGIPMWLDLVDREVKLSKAMTEAYLQRYLEPEVYERFFVEVRSKR